MFDYPVGYFLFHPNQTINYQLNRWLFEADRSEIELAGKEISMLADTKPVFLKLAEKAERELRWAHAATYYRGAEFFMLPSDRDKYPTYQKYRSMHGKSVADKDMERILVPYLGGSIQVIRIKASGVSRDTLIIHGGFDSYMEEFLSWGFEFAMAGFDVVLFEGPGQGASLRTHKLKMSPNWEQPVSAVLDRLCIGSCSLVGISLGGYLALRAAAYEKRIKRVVLVNALSDFLECFLAQAPRPVKDIIYQGLKDGDRHAINDLACQLGSDAAVAWAITHGQHVSGANDAFEFFVWLGKINTRSFSHMVTQPSLVTAGAEDHIVPLEQFFEQLNMLRNSAALTGQLFSSRDHASAHCQIGNQRLLLDTIKQWVLFDIKVGNKMVPET